MSREAFEIEKLLSIVEENGDTGVQVLFGSAAPGGDTGEQDDAPIGSFYLRTNGIPYFKLTDTNAAADWFSYDEIFTALGITKGDSDFGTFTGGILSDNSDAKSLFQELSDYIESNVVEFIDNDNVTTATVVDSEPVAGIIGIKYLCAVTLNSDPTRRRTFELFVTTDGTNVKDTIYARKRFGALFVYTVSSAINAGNLEISVSSTAGVDVNFTKIGVIQNT